MAYYAIRRLISAFLMLITMSIVTVLLFVAGPTDPARLTCGKNCTPQSIADNRHALGYDQPIYVQYGKMVKGLFVGRDFPDDPAVKKRNPQAVTHCPAPCLGYSTYRTEQVSTLFKERLPVSVSIALGAFVIWLVGGVLLGIIAALSRGRWPDRLLVGGSLVLYAFPTFFIGLILLNIVAIQYGLFPVPEYTPFTDNPAAWAQGLLLPWLTLAAVYAAGYVRLTRAYMLETQNEDFVRTARAKGLGERRVIVKHTLRAALTPIVTVAGLDLGGVLAGTIITEGVFNFNGLGKLAVDSVVTFDLPVIVPTVLVTAFFVIMSNLVVDLLYGVIDPRVRVGA